MRSDCADFRREAEAAQPTAVFGVVDAEGRERNDARVAIDGGAAAPLPAAPLPLDPGEHAIRFDLPGGANRSLRVVLHEGEKARRIVAEFLAPGSAAPSPSHILPPTPAVYVLGGAGVLALGSFAYFGLAGRSIQDDLERCAPFCQKPDVERMRARYFVADLSLIIAAASLGAGAYLFFRGHAVDEPKQVRAFPLRLRLETTHDGAGVWMGRDF